MSFPRNRLSIRITQIKTYEGEKVLIPNSSVFTHAVKVLTAYSFRRTDLAVGLDYNTSLLEARQLFIIGNYQKSSGSIN